MSGRGRGFGGRERGGGGDRGGSNRGDRGGGNRGDRGGGNRGDRGGGNRGDRGGGNRGDRGGGNRGYRGRGREPADIFRPDGSAAPPPPSAEVRRVEDGIITAQKTLSLQRLSLESGPKPLPPRPGYATQGVPIVLRTNYFHFKSTAKIPLFRYNVEIEPEEKQKRRRRRIFQLLWDTSVFSEIRDCVATDSSSTIISAKRVELDNDRGKIDITYYEKDQPGPHEKSKVYKLTIQKTGIITVEELLTYLCNTDAYAILDAHEETIQALNIVMAKRVNTAADIIPYGKNKYFVLENSPESLTGGLVALRGYYSSVRTSNSRILLNLNVCTSAFYSPILLSSLIHEFLGGNPPRGEWPKKMATKLRSFLRGLRVETGYIKRGGVPVIRVKTITGLSGPDGQAKRASEVVFQSDNGPCTVETWFKRQYDITLRFPLLPVVNVGKDNAVYVPAELCTVIQGQPFKGKINENQTRKMIEVACRIPAENARLITGEGCKVVGIAGVQQNMLAPFGITVNPSMLTVNGRVLTSPKVQYQGNNGIDTVRGSWNMANVKFTVPAELVTWGCLHFTLATERRDPVGNRLPEILSDFTGVLIDCGIATGHCYPSHVCELPGNDTENETAIQRGLRHFHGLDPRPKILLVVIPSTDRFTYAKIKYFGDTKAGMHTVCVVARKFAKPNNVQYHANVALKFNLKCGGVNQTLPPDKLGPTLRDGKTMLVGIDVTHPSPDSIRGVPSIAGVVASIDGYYAQWPASIVLQEGKKEMVTCIEDMMVERLKLWEINNSDTLPTKIVVYRDGVGESQYHQILEKELPPIQEAIRKVYGTRPKAKLSIIVVGKRHHTRFYPVNEDGAHGNGNPKNGTVVDRGITGVRFWDFFLQAHTGLQGTARPAHYVVVLDEIGLGADGLEQMTHNLCYLYGRATKSVSVCPPAYYADLLCERGRCYIHNLLNAEGSTTGSDSSEENFAMATRAWGRGVASGLKDSMFYI